MMFDEFGRFPEMFFANGEVVFDLLHRNGLVHLRHFPAKRAGQHTGCHFLGVDAIGQLDMCHHLVKPGVVV
jgi:hypothetical protein